MEIREKNNSGILKSGAFLILSWFSLVSVYSTGQLIYSSKFFSFGTLYADLALFFCFQLILSGVALFLLHRIFCAGEKEKKRDFSLSEALISGAPLLIYCLLFVIPYKTPSQNAIGEKFDLYSLLYTLLLCLGVGIIEEVFCRALLLRGFLSILKKSKQTDASCTGNGICPVKLKCTLISSALFGIWHIVNFFFLDAPLSFTVSQIVYTFFIGIFLSAVLLRTESLILCIVLHTLLDFAMANEVRYSIFSSLRSKLCELFSLELTQILIYFPLAILGIVFLVLPPIAFRKRDKVN